MTNADPYKGKHNVCPSCGHVTNYDASEPPTRFVCSPPYCNGAHACTVHLRERLEKLEADLELMKWARFNG